MIKYLRDLTPNRAVFLLIYFCLSGFYLQKIYFQDLNGFIFNTAGPIFLGLATLAGLSFTFASVVKSKEAKSTSIFTGEKLFHASAHILLATILGICAIELPIRPLPALYLLISPWQIFLIILKSVLVVVGFIYLLNAFYDARIGFEDLFELLSERKKRRLQIITGQKNEVRKETGAPKTEEPIINKEVILTKPMAQEISRS